MTSRVETALSRLAADRPLFHTEDTDHSWCALPGTLRMLAGFVAEGQRTLEVGCGASTVIFAAAPTTHVAMSPDAAEHERIRTYCSRIDFDAGAVEFLTGTSDELLPGLDPSLELDVAFIDGDHSFPHPVIDWHYVNKHLKVGGVLVMDDMPTQAVAVVGRKMLGSPDWELIESADQRAAAFRKLAHRVAYDDFRDDPFNLGPDDYGFLPRGEAARLTARDRANWAKAGLGRRFPALRRIARRGS
jgi:predicted O-methyltransferase YrrM